MKYGLSDEQLAEICSVIGSYPQIEEAVIYGSRADGSYKEASDVDIAIKGKKADQSIASKLKFFLEEETYLPFFFDVIAYNANISAALKKQIKTKGKTIYRKGWIYTKLGKVIGLGNGMARPKTKGKIPLYGGNGILGYSSESNYDGDTIIIGRVGRYCGSVYFEDKPIWISGNAFSAKPKGNHNTKFLYYFLQNLNLNKKAQGSSHPLITQALLNSLDIFICNNVAEQKAITEILSSLDDKIDLLHRQNRTLENIAQILFQKWFIEDADEAWEEKKFSKRCDDIALGLKNNTLQLRVLNTIRSALLPKLMNGEAWIKQRL